MSDRQKYDAAQKALHDKAEREESQSAAEQFVKGVFGFPKTVYNEFTKSEIEEKAERDWMNSRYDPPED